MDLSAINEALGEMAPAEVALGAGVLAVIGTLLVIGQVVCFLISAIGYYKMFRKGGQRGWFAFIPILRDFALFKMAWTVKAFVITTVLLAAFQYTAESENILLGVVSAVLGIAWLVMQVKLCLRTAKAFGKGAGWGVLLLILPIVAAPVLGFGSAEYLGNPEEQKAAEGSVPGEV